MITAVKKVKELKVITLEIRGGKRVALKTGSGEAEIPPHFDGKTSSRVCFRGVRTRSCHKVLSRRVSVRSFSPI